MRERANEEIGRMRKGWSTTRVIPVAVPAKIFRTTRISQNDRFLRRDKDLPAFVIVESIEPLKDKPEKLYAETSAFERGQTLVRGTVYLMTVQSRLQSSLLRDTQSSDELGKCTRGTS